MTVKQELNQLLYKQQEESYSHISILLCDWWLGNEICNRLCDGTEAAGG